ncbi:helix-turn-helix transcriptional regulator [Dysgonomonas sp. ZJ279]|uniref:helix-turn-helix transcriptional regulator n=1 Tax=Dysgonomonas sp. ZJ279 TaxID=2709796 RepID=UPI0013ED2322|nr:AraC family transcriptional regulator [Dysgonomonas sp. ZJ279]
MPKDLENPKFILLNVGYSELNANWNWKKIYSPFARIYYVSEGDATIYINEATYDLKPDHLYLIPPFTLHNDECKSYFSLYYVHFYEDVINRESMFDKYDFPIEIRATSLDMMLVRRLWDINPDRQLRHYDPQLYDNPPTFSQYVADNNKMSRRSKFETQGILYQLLSKFYALVKLKADSKDIRVNNVLKYIHETTENNITLTQLASIACVTIDHFIRIFKKEMKCTPLKYINMKKIEKAQLLLLTTDMPIREVALELSLDNISYFNRIFKYYTGRTPTEYRKIGNKF